jgi:germination protein M
MRRALTTLTIAVVLALAACGLPEDGEPRAIPEDDLPPELEVEASTTSLPPGQSSPRILYFVDNSGEQPVLQPVERPIPEGAGLQGVLDALLTDPGTEERITRVPPGVELLGVFLDEEDGTLTVDLSDEFGELEGEALQLAVAQVVLTATEFDEVQQVRFELEGEPTPVPTSGRSQELVNRCDYAEFDPDPGDCP